MPASPLILCVGAGQQQFPFMSKLLRLGCNLAAFDRDPQAPGFELTDHHSAISTWDAPRALAWVQRLRMQPDAVMCFSYGKALVTQQALLDALDLPGALPPELAAISGDKALLARCLQASGARELVLSPECGVDRVRKHAAYIIKDRYGGSSRNIARVDAQTLKAKLPFIDWASTVVEPVFEGQEYRIAAIFQHGRPLVINRLRRESLPGTFLTARLCSEPETNSVEAGALWSFLEKMHPNLSAPVKADIIGKKIIEIDFGLSGDYLERHMTEFSGASDITPALLDLYLGCSLPPLTPVPQGCTLDYIFLEIGQTFTLSYADIQSRANAILGDFKIIPIQPEGTSDGRRATNMDALFAILHRQPERRHQELSTWLLSPQK